MRKLVSAPPRVEQAPVTIAPQEPAEGPRKGRDGSSPRTSVGRLPVFAGILLLVLGSAFTLLRRPEVEDPHFTRAKVVLERYELGKPEEARDYGDPVYGEALAELAGVDRASRWARPADELASDILRRSVEQQARVSTRAVEMRSRQELEQGRDEEFFRERRLRPSPDPGAPAPQCAEDEAAKTESTPAPDPPAPDSLAPDPPAR